MFPAARLIDNAAGSKALSCERPTPTSNGSRLDFCRRGVDRSPEFDRQRVYHRRNFTRDISGSDLVVVLRRKEITVHEPSLRHGSGVVP